MTAYARDVVAGRIVAGPWVRLAGQRHLDDLTTGHTRGLRFDEDRANHAIEFFPEFLRLTGEGQFDGEPFVLQPWQQFIMGSLFGWLGPDGYRRFQSGYIECGKGAGKTPMLAGVLLYGLMFDKESGAQIVCAARAREQARMMFDDCLKMARASVLAERLDINKNNILDMSTNSWIRPVSAEAQTLEGKRIHMAGIDEVWTHPTADVVNALRKGTKARRQPLILEITNSGFDRTSVCWDHHEYSIKIVQGVLQDDAWFAYTCGLDQDQHTRVFHTSVALEKMVNLCSCGYATATQNASTRHTGSAANAISPPTEMSERSGVLSTPTDPSRQRGSAQPATTEAAPRLLSDEQAYGPPRNAGTPRTLTDWPPTSEDGWRHDLDIDSSNPSSKSSGVMASPPNDMKNSSLGRADDARSAERSRDTSRLITTTRQEPIGDSSASNATQGSGSSETLRRAYSGHSPTCAVRQRGTLKGATLEVEYPPDDPFASEACWPKANPNIDVSLPAKYLRGEVERARGMPSETGELLRKNFCVWTQQQTRFIPIDKWLACGKLQLVTDADLVGLPCWAGLDMGQRDDFTALVMVWRLADDAVAVRCRFWLPRSTVEAHPERPYAQWEDEGRLTVTEGADIDFPRVGAEIAELCVAAGVREVNYDKRYAEELSQRLVGQGLDMIQAPQGFALNEPLTALLGLIAAGKLHHGNHPILTWMADNLEVAHNLDGHVRPVKPKVAGDARKIDGMVALAMALDRMIRTPETTSIYDQRLARGESLLTVI